MSFEHLKSPAAGFPGQEGNPGLACLTNHKYYIWVSQPYTQTVEGS